MVTYNTMSYLFVGLRIKDLSEHELARINLKLVNHIDVGPDLYVGYSLPPHLRDSEYEIAAAKKRFMHVTKSVTEPKVFQVDVVTNIEEVTA